MFDNEISKVIEKVSHRIFKLGDNHPSNAQLNKILKELEYIKREHNFEYRPSFPRMVIDSWDLNDELGCELLRINEVIERLRKSS